MTTDQIEAALLSAMCDQIDRDGECRLVTGDQGPLRKIINRLAVLEKQVKAARVLRERLLYQPPLKGCGSFYEASPSAVANFDRDFSTLSQPNTEGATDAT